MAFLLVVKLAFALVVICMVLGPVPHSAETPITCAGVRESLTPCIPHLKSSGPSQAAPPTNCCDGVRSVSALARTTTEHRAVCQCLKSIAANTQGLNYDLAAHLPAQCGVTMSYTFGPNTDCANIA